MPRNIHGYYYEDTYVKHEFQSCKRCFIVGEALSENMTLSCSYCQSQNVITTAASTEEAAEDMEMGCLGLYFNRYDDGRLMLYTEHEFAQAMKGALENNGGGGIPLRSVHRIIGDYCARRDDSGSIESISVY